MLHTQRVMAFVATTDFNRARAFYRDTLKLNLASEDDFALVFESNGTNIRVVKVHELNPVRWTVLGWDVADVEAELNELVRAGVVFEKYGFPGQDERGVWSAPGGAKVAWFKDPDGNVLSISQHT